MAWICPSCRSGPTLGTRKRFQCTVYFAGNHVKSLIHISLLFFTSMGADNIRIQLLTYK